MFGCCFHLFVLAFCHANICFEFGRNSIKSLNLSNGVFRHKKSKAIKRVCSRVLRRITSIFKFRIQNTLILCKESRSSSIVSKVGNGGQIC